MIFNSFKKIVHGFSITLLNQEVIQKCLSGDTLILLSSGEQIPLMDLTYNHSVMGMNGQPTKVIGIHRGFFNEFHNLYYFEDDIVIDETHDHRFFNYDKNRWEKLKDWNIGDHAVDSHGKKIALLDKQRLNEPAEMFGLWTESHDYYANNLLSGDARANLHLLADGDLASAVKVLSSVEPKEWFELAG